MTLESQSFVILDAAHLLLKVLILSIQTKQVNQKDLFLFLHLKLYDKFFASILDFFKTIDTCVLIVKH